MNLLEVRSISKIFGGLLAVDQVSFELEQGSIVGLIGPNGAGKTTVFNCIAGNSIPEKGQIIFQGDNIVGTKPHQLVQKGIARTFQNLRLFGTLPVLENVLAGRHCRMSTNWLASLLRLPKARKVEAEALERCWQELDFVGLSHLAKLEAASLSYGQQRLLEMARAMASDPILLLLDEPAGGMNDRETANLMQTITAIKERGISILLVEHDMRLIMRICDKVLVLDNGCLIAQGKPEQVAKEKAVIEAYLGVEQSESSFRN